jgi:hypothetical protein
MLQGHGLLALKNNHFSYLFVFLNQVALLWHQILFFMPAQNVFEIDFDFIREKVTNRDIQLRHISTLESSCNHIY